ncbi:MULTISPECIES: transposase [Coriobacteriales]|uniref:Transposase n=1 Tax=Enorma phocaeensis TaxID=1871019 RepID=A0A921IUM8_9ACTN|nr:transposase [Enorma phocaeensis]HJG36404.1 transposase [Enorma phocaeensis]
MRAKLTEELIQRMASLKGDGLSNKDICRAVGIHEATLYRWLSKPSGRLHRALGESLKKAEADYKRTLLTTIREAATKKNGQWTAAAWLLERKYPDEYAQTTRDRGELADAAPQIVLGVAVGVAKPEADEDESRDEVGGVDG